MQTTEGLDGAFEAGKLPLVIQPREEEGTLLLVVPSAFPAAGPAVVRAVLSEVRTLAEFRGALAAVRIGGVCNTIHEADRKRRQVLT
jgi:hypothetical protein